MPGASRPFLIGVAGGTCAGKTMVCERLAAMAGDDEVALIRLDSYQVDHSRQSVAERAATNYDHPDAYDWDLLNDHLARLVAGHSVMAPTYDFTVHNRSSIVRQVQPAPVIVVEGILVLHDPALRERFDLKVYVDADADLRFIRRLKRDVAERGRTPDSIIEQYLTTVRPGHEQFIEPSKRHADVIFPCGGRNEPAIELLLARVHELTRRH
jgi:uridine kinase